jgi:hypothetical protein
MNLPATLRAGTDALGFNVAAQLAKANPMPGQSETQEDNRQDLAGNP